MSEHEDQRRKIETLKCPAAIETFRPSGAVYRDVKEESKR